MLRSESRYVAVAVALGVVAPLLAVINHSSAVANSACTTTVATDPASWTGSDPWPIASVDELIFLSVVTNDSNLTSDKRAEYLNADYVLVGQDTSWALGDCLWDPIGYGFGGDLNANPATNEFFSGTFDGSGKTITGLNVDKSTAYSGLFGAVGGNALIKDVTLSGSVRSSQAYAGGVVGYANVTVGTQLVLDNVTSNVDVTQTAGGSAGGLAGYVRGRVEDSLASGSVSAANFAGGLVGYLDAGQIVRSTASGDVTSNDYAVGGLVGYAYGVVTIEDSSTLGDVSSTNYSIGGLVGLMEDAGASQVTGAETSGNVTGTYFVGGLIGQTTGTGTAVSIQDSTSSSIVSGDHNLGGLVGSMTNGEIVRSSASGSVTSEDTDTSNSNVGGLVGYMDDGGTVSDSSASGRVTAPGTRVGGLIARADGGVVENSSASGAVSGRDEVGGLVGEAQNQLAVRGTSATGAVTGKDEVGGLVGRLETNSSVTSSFASGSVTAEDEVGGLVGRSEDASTISYSFAIGTVEGIQDVGGLVGDTSSSSSISDSYATGAVSASSSRAGGLVGDPGAGVTRSYSTGVVAAPAGVGGLLGDAAERLSTGSFWDLELSGVATSPAGGTGKTTAEMTTLATFSTASWAIVAAAGFEEPTGPSDEIWGIGPGVNCGYPFLWWQTVSAHSCPAPSTSEATTSGSTERPEERADSPAIHLDLQTELGNAISGAPVVIGGEGLAGGSAYTLVVRSTPQVVDSGTASALGNFSKRLSMPALASGSHTLTLTATAPDGSTLTLVQPFAVGPNGVITALSATTGSTSAVLAATGASGPLMMGGLSVAALLLLAGLITVMVARRRSMADS